MISEKHLYAGLAVSFATGFAVGYVVSEKRLTTKYERMLEDEIQKAKQFYAQLNKTDEFSTPAAAMKALVGDDVVEEIIESAAEDLVEQAEDALRDYSKITVAQNLFTDVAIVDPDFDLKAASEAAEKSDTEIISFDEFSQNENDWPQVSLTYFAGDDTLIDERDQVIDDHYRFIGDALERFGQRSKDPLVVYVRNKRLEVEYEVNKSGGSYQHEVLGEIQHSADPRMRRRSRGRGDDE